MNRCSRAALKAPALALAASMALLSTARADPIDDLIALLDGSLAARAMARCWCDLGMGWAAQSRTDSGANNSGDAMVFDTLIGRRLNDRWFMGPQIGAFGTYLNGNSTFYDNNFIHAIWAVRYLPRSDHGWIWGLGAGFASHYDKSLQSSTVGGDGRVGDGVAANAAVGYDWKIGPPESRAHVELMLSVEQGQIYYNAPLTGQFNYTEFAATVHFVVWPVPGV